VASESETTRRRRPQERTAEGGRRLHSAGSAVIVALCGLLISALLNAPGIHKSAVIQPEGWKRDLALAVTRPLESVSHSLLLDRPRKALKAALGRSDDDKFDTGVAVPGTGIEPEPSPPTAPPKRVRHSPERPLRLWIAGDSLVIVPGESLLRAVVGNRAIEPARKVDGRIASGLERPDVFNWFTYIRRQVRKLKPNAIVLEFGGNDDHSYMTGLPKGVSIGAFGSSSWRAEYRRRVAGLLDTAARDGVFVVWIGLPITRSPAQTGRFDTINAIVEAETRKRPGRAAYVDTYSTFASDDGGFAQYLANSSGKHVLVRAPDGVHFEPAGGDIIARTVLRRLNEQFDLTSWRKRANG
jgi:uncharacterized protein